jgi:hypothetical protein
MTQCVTGYTPQRPRDNFASAIRGYVASREVSINYIILKKSYTKKKWRPPSKNKKRGKNLSKEEQEGTPQRRHCPPYHIILLII